MPSVACAGTAERMVERMVFKVLRAGSETAARYLSTSFEPSSLFADGRRFGEAAFVVGITVVSRFSIVVSHTSQNAQWSSHPVLQLRLGPPRTRVTTLSPTSARSLLTSL